MSIELLLTKIVEQNTVLIQSLGESYNKIEQQNQIILGLLQENNELLMQINDEETPNQTKNLDD
ncbi:hypothetical protein [Acinetobacter rudis]|uniref:hypothetical protein n=1 Tax=Acinetobacter rudis TaxID=632955 RepID=UPI00333F9B66